LKAASARVGTSHFDRLSDGDKELAVVMGAATERIMVPVAKSDQPHDQRTFG
jgi:hypothetical protein